MRDSLFKSVGGLMILALIIGCAATVYAPGPPPTPKVEVKSHPPGPKAVWIPGHWNWDGDTWTWISGHWVKKPKGKWVEGHWAKRRHGHVWVPGHWKR
jgi:hypothetical protein